MYVIQLGKLSINIVDTLSSWYRTSKPLRTSSELVDSFGKWAGHQNGQAMIRSLERSAHSPHLPGKETDRKVNYLIILHDEISLKTPNR
jgi:hypothetical protein